MPARLPLAIVATTLLGSALAGCAADADPVTDTSDVTNASCLPTLACKAPAKPAMKPRMWRHPLISPAKTLTGDANHRGRDAFVNPGQRQTIIAKFAYGLTDVDLEDEEVDVYVQRDCTSGWEQVGTAITTTDGNAPNLEGVTPANGRIYFPIPAGKELGPGRHRVLLVVAGDGTSTELTIDVVPPKTPIFVSDVDGTLTSSEAVEFVKLLTDDLPETHRGAPEALRALAAKGYRPVYVTARPEWLTQRTRDFLDKHGFPPGIVRTSTTLTGAGFGDAAANFKKGEMNELARRGLVPTFGFGNKQSDADAYAPIPIANRRIFLKADTSSGRRIESYTELLPELSNLAAACL
jgi:phosphatidate phosphatase PAH1